MDISGEIFQLSETDVRQFVGDSSVTVAEIDAGST